MNTFRGEPPLKQREMKLPTVGQSADHVLRDPLAGRERDRPLSPRRVSSDRRQMLQAHPGFVLPKDQPALTARALLELRVHVGQPRLDDHRVGLQCPLGRPFEREPPAGDVPADRREIKPHAALALDQLLDRAARPQQRRDPQLIGMSALDRRHQPGLLRGRQRHLRLRIPPPLALGQRLPASPFVALAPAAHLPLAHPQRLRYRRLSPALH